MKKLILYILLFTSISLNVGAETGTINETTIISSGSNILTGTTYSEKNTDENISNSLNIVNEKKKELINDLTGVDELSTKIKQLETEIQNKKIQNTTLEQMNSDYENKIKELTENSAKKTKGLEQEIIYYKNAISENNNTIAKIKAEQINTTLILENLSKLKLELDAQKNSVYYKKILELGVILLFIIIGYVTTRILYNKEKQDTEYFTNSSKKIARLNISNVIFIILFIFLITFGSIYIRTELAIGLLLFGSSLIIVLKDIILSFIGTIFVILNYDIGDMLGYEANGLKTNGILVKVTPLYMNIKEYNDNKEFFTGRIVKIPNKAIFENSIIKNSNNFSNLVQEEIILPIATRGMLEKKENEMLPEKYLEKLNNIQNILDTELNTYSMSELGIFSDFYGEKYKKQFINDKDNNIFVEYVWLRKKGNDNLLKEKLLKEFFI